MSLISLRRKLSVDNNSSDGDLDDVSTPSPLLRNISIETDEHNDHINLYGSSISLDCSTPLTNRKVSDAIGRSCHNHSNDNIDGLPGNYSKGSSAVCGGGSDDVEDHDQLSSMFKSIVANIIESETLYVDYLHLMNQVFIYLIFFFDLFFKMSESYHYINFSGYLTFSF